ncbi:MAG: DUF4062 domain-containing protein [Flectobacillus sp.]|nr:DUF4062 domain-containing protein [Flectobacillus sp.]
MHKKVFISSTFTDLKEYRESVQHGVRQLGLIDISMENFGARDERPKDECLRIIKEESDLFVGIYAHRYGFIPKGDKLSITQLEYLAASEIKIPKLIYVIDEELPFPPKYIDDGRAKVQLRKFKESLFSKHICKTFNNKDNLTASVVADLGRTISIEEKRNLVGKNIPVRNIVSVSEKIPLSKPIEYWNDARNEIYEYSRGIFIAHVIKPSTEKGQLYDVFIYLYRHKSDDFSDVKYAEFFLGPYWNNKVFEATEEKKGFIGISTSAYGTFLCTCKVTFQDNSQIEIHRYIDFESERMA